MSFQALAWAWEQRTGSAGRKAVLGALAQFADEHGVCYPSQETIARHTEQSVRTVREHMAALETAGFITRVGRKKADGTINSDLIQLNIQRQISPTADFACGEKPQNPAAKIAAKPVSKTNYEPSGKKQSARAKPAQPDLPADGDVSGPMTLDDLVAIGVERQHAADWLAVRKLKRAGSLTVTAFDGLRREAAKAGLSLDAAVQVCAERSWVSLKAAWLMADQARSVSAGGFDPVAYVNQGRVDRRPGAGRAEKVINP